MIPVPPPGYRYGPDAEAGLRCFGDAAGEEPPPSPVQTFDPLSSSRQE